MSDFDSAIKAKREKNFDLALEYYEKIFLSEGFSENLLRAIGKIYYLKGDHNHAIKCYLAATHLSLYSDYQQYQQGDVRIRQALQQIPETLVNQFPHPIGALLLFDENSPRHIAHALLDRENTYQEMPEFRPFAEIYYSYLLGDGSHVSTLQKYNLTQNDLLAFEKEHYMNIGFQFLINAIQWTEIENTNVLELYFKRNE